VIQSIKSAPYSIVETIFTATASHGLLQMLFNYFDKFTMLHWLLFDHTERNSSKFFAQCKGGKPRIIASTIMNIMIQTSNQRMFSGSLIQLPVFTLATLILSALSVFDSTYSVLWWRWKLSRMYHIWKHNGLVCKTVSASSVTILTSKTAYKLSFTIICQMLADILTYSHILTGSLTSALWNLDTWNAYAAF
jgi:hypothetical protein